MPPDPAVPVADPPVPPGSDSPGEHASKAVEAESTNSRERGAVFIEH
jgi:hypothetical protein